MHNPPAPSRAKRRARSPDGRRPDLLPISERDWLGRVIALARLNGWLIWHPLPALFRDGQWRTATQGTPGFPDLIALRAGHLVVAELKTQRAPRPSPAQRKWLAEFAAAGISTYVWRPEDWPQVVNVFTATKVVVDPRRGFGRPIIDRARLPVDAIVDRWRAGESMAVISEDLEVSLTEVEDVLCVLTPRRVRPS